MESQLYPIAGTTTSSCASQDFDFLNYWVDQTVENEIIRGKKLRELKESPKSRKDYDVIKIKNTFSKKKCKSRRTSPTIRVSRGKSRRNSPYRKNSPTRRLAKQVSKASRHRCPMRIAELAVPSKRQCIDTWRNNHHILPGIMIDRLRAHVMDLTPVVKIPEAIDCFKRHTKIRKKKRTNKNNDDKINKKLSNTSETQYLSAIFGHRIGKLLNKPVQVILNSELQSISKIVFIDIERLVNKGKSRNDRIINKKMQTEVAGKVSIWIANVLQDTDQKVLEDQLQDLEEEVGPVLDLIDDLVDSVVNLSEPISVKEVSSSSEYREESDSEYKDEEDLSLLTEQDKTKDEEIESFTVEIESIETESATEVNLDDFIRNELDNILSTFEDGPSEIEENTNEDFAEEADSGETIEVENVTDKEQNEFVDANDFEVPIEQIKPMAEQVLEESFGLESDTDPDLGILSINQDDKDIDQGIPTLEHEAKGPDLGMPSVEQDATTPDKGMPSLEPEAKIPDLGIPSIEQDATVTDQSNLNITQESNEDIETLTDTDSNKKVKFSDINIVTNDFERLQGTIRHKTSFIPNITFSLPNENLFSDADESWPPDMIPPIIRPSESVSKSITSLGKIMEAEEKIDDHSTDSTQIVNGQNNYVVGDQESGTQNISGYESVDLSKQIYENNDVINDSESIDRKIETLNVTAFLTGKETELPNDVNEINDTTKDVNDGNEIVKTKTDTKILELNEQGELSSHKIINEPHLNEESELDIAETIEPIEIKEIMDVRKELAKTFSKDSVFDHNIPIEAILYEHTLDNIIEEATIYSAKDNEELGPKKIKTADKEVNTSFLVESDDKTTSVTSQSLRDITKRFKDKKGTGFSSLRIKSKMDYKVDADAAPSWVTRNIGEPRDSNYTTPQKYMKGANDSNIRMWCKDLENGFDNLELWNGWLDNTLQNIKVMERKKARICIDKSRNEFARDWLHLKNNVDTDVPTWVKLSKDTKDKLKGFRKIYPNFSILSKKKDCKCHIQSDNL